MPHAEMTQTQTLINGEEPSSKFISHVTSYPVVHDGIENFKSNPYGAKSIQIADATYSRFGKPFEPYLKGPYSYAKPYVEKADSLADQSLKTVDTRFPIVKEETHTVIDTTLSYVLYPVHVGNRGYQYVMATWNDEYSKTVRRNDRGPGLASSLMALVSTELKISSDMLQAAADFLYTRKEEAKKKKDDFSKWAADQKTHDYPNAYSSALKRNADAYIANLKDKKDQAANATTNN